jgi:hypothetical protein
MLAREAHKTEDYERRNLQRRFGAGRDERSQIGNADIFLVAPLSRVRREER